MSFIPSLLQLELSFRSIRLVTLQEYTVLFWVSISSFAQSHHDVKLTAHQRMNCTVEFPCRSQEGGDGFEWRTAKSSNC
jgi:hypothetical protein